MPSTETPHPVDVLNGEGNPDFIILCDHASNRLPAQYGTLGLPPAELSRHIAWDIGAAGVARHLSARLSCPVVLGGYSRLLVDLNRGEDDPTIVMKLSDGSIIPGNRDVDAYRNATEFHHRIEAYHAPYHRAVGEMVSAAIDDGVVPVIISVHSFTPSWRGVVRSWHTAVLWDRDPRVAVPLIEMLREEEGLVVGDNEPYSGRLRNDCLYQHGTIRGLPHVLLEIRQDLIADEAGQIEWAERYARHLLRVGGLPDVRQIRHYGSHTDPE